MSCTFLYFLTPKFPFTTDFSDEHGWDPNPFTEVFTNGRARQATRASEWNSLTEAREGRKGKPFTGEVRRPMAEHARPVTLHEVTEVAEGGRPLSPPRPVNP